MTTYISCVTVHGLVYLRAARQRGLAYAAAVDFVSRYDCTKTVAYLKMATSSTPTSTLRQRTPRMYLDLRAALQTFAFATYVIKNGTGFTGPVIGAATWNIICKQSVTTQRIPHPTCLYVSRDCCVEPRLHSSAERCTQTRHATCFSLPGLWSLFVTNFLPVSSPARRSSNDALDTDPSARQWYDPNSGQTGRS